MWFINDSFFVQNFDIKLLLFSYKLGFILYLSFFVTVNKCCTLFRCLLFPFHVMHADHSCCWDWLNILHFLLHLLTIVETLGTFHWLKLSPIKCGPTFSEFVIILVFSSFSTLSIWVWCNLKIRLFWTTWSIFILFLL